MRSSFLDEEVRNTHRWRIDQVDGNGFVAGDARSGAGCRLHVVGDARPAESVATAGRDAVLQWVPADGAVASLCLLGG